MRERERKRGTHTKGECWHQGEEEIIMIVGKKACKKLK